ncbi:MAG TPA: PCMD domain-containing protein [Candidatus Didemnitutus sp.]|nr:PCMD domain-containing protein [Candidatus Didemnitutus sp.]
MRIVMVMMMIIMTTTVVRAQQQIPNGGLEDWTRTPGSGSFKDYEEPSGGWTSGNGVIHIAAGADPVCEKSSESHSGQYAAKLTTRSVFGQVASGSMYLGVFSLNLANPASSAKRGIPYAGPVPTRFRGFYRYQPQGNDSAAIYAMFTRWNGNARVLIHEARLTITEATPTWTELNISIPPFDEAPDSMSVVAASSADGENFRGSVGSTLFVDDFSFEWTTSLVEETRGPMPIIISGTTAILPLVDRVRTVCAVDLTGRTLDLGPVNGTGGIDLAPCKHGLWFIIARDERNVVIARSSGIVVR